MKANIHSYNRVTIGGCVGIRIGQTGLSPGTVCDMALSPVHWAYIESDSSVSTGFLL
jgi:hypothetical protein